MTFLPSIRLSSFFRRGLGAVVIALGALSPARAAVCPPQGVPPAFEFEHFVAKPVINNTQSQQWIQNQPGGNPRTRAQTRSHLQSNIHLEFTYQIDPVSGWTCAYLKKGRFRLGFDELTVFIANRFKPGSCQYQILETHEKEHVEISRQALEEYAPQIEQKLAEAVRNYHPVPTLDRRKAGQSIGQSFQSLLKSEKEAFNALHNGRQKAIDTPENYLKLEKLCRSW